MESLCGSGLNLPISFPSVSPSRGMEMAHNPRDMLSLIGLGANTVEGKMLAPHWQLLTPQSLAPSPHIPTK